MVGNKQLPEWQQKCLSRLPDLYTADRVPNSEKLKGKWRFMRSSEEGDVSEQCVIADLGSSGHSQRLWLKLVPFVDQTDARKAAALGPSNDADLLLQCPQITKAEGGHIANACSRLATKSYDSMPALLRLPARRDEPVSAG